MIYSDLAMETKGVCEHLSGIRVEHEKAHGITFTRVRVESDEGARLIGKPKGSYITVERDKLREMNEEEQNAFCAALASEIKALFPDTFFSSVLIAGIGNRDLTPDALGPRTIEGIFVTGHIPDFTGCKTYVLSPGVTGQTGIETQALIGSVIDRIKPDLVIVIDALCARSTSRILSTVQLSDAGVVPGSGLNNRRCVLNSDMLHTKVLAIGVPTVVHASTIIEDALESRHIENIELTDLLEEEKMVVTPADIDEEMNLCAGLIAKGINLFLHPDWDIK